MASSTHPLSLLDLDSDVLRAILLRTCAEDHPNLRKTCTRVASALDSREFRIERCVSGWAQVSTHLWTPYEMYVDANEHESCSSGDSYFLEHYNDNIGYKDPHLGYREGRADLLVDGEKVGTATFTIVPRRSRRFGSLHSIADALSGELHNVAVRFFDRQGKPRLESLRQALHTKDNKAGLLYIAEFKLNDPSYRTAPEVGAKLLRSLLAQKKLKRQWSVAAYIPEAGIQLTVQEMKELKIDRMEQFQASMHDVDISNADEVAMWDQRADDLVKRDMLQFFSAGFQQAKETVWTSDCFHVFAVPSFMEHPMLSHQEAKLVAVFEKPLPKCAPTGVAGELLKAMIRFCCDKTQLVNDRDENQRLFDSQLLNFYSIPAGGRLSEENAEKIHRREAELRSILASWNEYERNSAEMETTCPELVMKSAARDGTGAVRRELGKEWARLQKMKQQLIDSMRASSKTKLDTLDGEIKQLDSQVQAKVEELVGRSGAGIVLDSDAIHACASNLNPAYIRLLLDFVPELEKRNVINSLDQLGVTPLMAAAESMNFKRYSIENRLRTCQVLVELGADKSIVDASGLTALGRFRREDRAQVDFRECFGLRSDLYTAIQHAVPDMEEFLLPVGGSTPADDAMVETYDSDESEWEMDEDSDEEA